VRAGEGSYASCGGVRARASPLLLLVLVLLLACLSSRTWVGVVDDERGAVSAAQTEQAEQNSA